MVAPIFVDLANGGGLIRIDPPVGPSSSVRLIIATPRQFGDNGETLETAATADFYMSRQASQNLINAMSLALDQQIQKMVGMVP